MCEFSKTERANGSGAEVEQEYLDSKDDTNFDIHHVRNKLMNAENLMFQSILKQNGKFNTKYMDHFLLKNKDEISYHDWQCQQGVTFEMAFRKNVLSFHNILIYRKF